MPQLDVSHFPSQLFWLALSFGILFVAVQYWFSPKIKGALKTRHRLIEKKLDEISLFQKKIEESEREREQAVLLKGEEIAEQLEKVKNLSKQLLKKEEELLNAQLKLKEEALKTKIGQQKESAEKDLEKYAQEVAKTVIQNLSAQYVPGKK